MLLLLSVSTPLGGDTQKQDQNVDRLMHRMFNKVLLTPQTYPM
jgi:hypothetical protein